MFDASGRVRNSDPNAPGWSEPGTRAVALRAIAGMRTDLEQRRHRLVLALMLGAFTDCWGAS